MTYFTYFAAAPVSGKKRVRVDSCDDNDEAGLLPGSAASAQRRGGGSPQASNSSVKKRRLIRHGLITLTNEVVSMMELELSDAVQLKA